MIIRGEVTKDKLENVYQVIRSIIDKPDCYYTKEEIEKLKTNEKNIFLRRDVNVI